MNSMNKNYFCLSSSGLKNINKEDKDFTFIFGSREVRMNIIFAEFFSPLVSRLHLSDPTIDSFNFDYPSDVEPKLEELISDDILFLIENLSSGSKVSINEEQNNKLQIISALIDNEELFDELNKLFPKEINQTNVDYMLNRIQLIENLSQSNINKYFDLTQLIDTVSSHFYLIDEIKLKKLSKPILLTILSNKNLKIKSEDWLFDFIQSIHIDNDDNICDIDFYEQICISNLSEVKFKKLILSINPSELTTILWQNICESFLKEDIIQSNRYAAIQYSQNIIVSGYDEFNQLNENPNNTSINNCLIIDPSIKLSFDSSSHQSYSISGRHSVKITNEGSLLGIGFNSDNRISSSLQQKSINQFTEFCIKDSNGNNLSPVSAVCCQCGTLYMLSKSDGLGKKQLVLCDKGINNGKEVFLDIGDQEPVALFGGYYNAASINNKGEIIFINRESIINSPSSPISSFSLPDGEKASSVACCNDVIVVLSSSGRVFSSVIEKGSNVLKFSEVNELSSQEIVCVSGTYEHCICVSRKGRVFARGSNSHGQLGLGKETSSVSSFEEISSLSGLEIRAAYAGGRHSLFETREGKILSCGWNICGQLFLSNGEGEIIYLPRETSITNGATFCIAGWSLSVIFIGGEPPPNTPNRRIQHHL